MSYSTDVVNGEHFGYPKQFGDAYVTYLNEDIVQLEFKNGVVENRSYEDGACVCQMIDSKGNTQTRIN